MLQLRRNYFSQLLDYEEDGEFHLISATAAFIKRDLKRIAGFCEVVVPCYAIAEFRSCFRMTKTTFEVLAHWKKELSAAAILTLSTWRRSKNGVWPGTGFEWQNGKHIFRLEIPFGNFSLPFKKSRFPEKMSVRGDKMHLSIYIPSEISGIFG